MNYIQIGKIVATHGVKGDVIIEHAFGSKKGLKEVTALFVEEVKGSYIPYFVENYSTRNQQELLVKIEGINSKEAAQRLVKRNVWLEQSDFAKIADAAAPIALIGYMVFDDEQPLSEVLEVIEQPHQVLLRIEYQTKEVLIPIHEETLDKIDRVKRQIYVTLPDGLLDIYLK